MFNFLKKKSKQQEVKLPTPSFWQRYPDEIVVEKTEKAFSVQEKEWKELGLVSIQDIEKKLFTKLQLPLSAKIEKLERSSVKISVGNTIYSYVLDKQTCTLRRKENPLYWLDMPFGELRFHLIQSLENTSIVLKKEDGNWKPEEIAKAEYVVQELLKIISLEEMDAIAIYKTLALWLPMPIQVEVDKRFPARITYADGYYRNVEKEYWIQDAMHWKVVQKDKITTCENGEIHSKRPVFDEWIECSACATMQEVEDILNKIKNAATYAIPEKEIIADVYKVNLEMITNISYENTKKASSFFEDTGLFPKEFQLFLEKLGYISPMQYAYKDGKWEITDVQKNSVSIWHEVLGKDVMVYVEHTHPLMETVYLCKPDLHFQKQLFSYFGKDDEGFYQEEMLENGTQFAYTVDDSYLKVKDQQFDEDIRKWFWSVKDNEQENVTDFWKKVCRFSKKIIQVDCKQIVEKDAVTSHSSISTELKETYSFTWNKNGIQVEYSRPGEGTIIFEQYPDKIWRLEMGEYALFSTGEYGAGLTREIWKMVRYEKETNRCIKVPQDMVEKMYEKYVKPNFAFLELD